MLIFNIRHQEISRIDKFYAVEKSENYLQAVFNFKTEDWDGTIKTAIFKNTKSGVIKDVILSEDRCIIPWEVLTEKSKMEVAVHGTTPDTRITTNFTEFHLNPTLYGGSATEEPTPDVYQQILERLEELKTGGGSATGYYPTVEGTTLVFNEIIDGNEVSY